MSDRRFKYANWNAHSILNKKIVVESILHIHDLDLLVITETWLTAKNPVWQIRGYVTFRQDRQEQRPGGGVLILVRRELVVSSIRIPKKTLKHIDSIGITITTSRYKIQIVAAYAPPNKKIPPYTWSDLLEGCDGGSPIILMGDFNAHSWSWGSEYCSARGNHLREVTEDFGLIPLNDSLPTFVGGAGRSGSNIDLVFVSSHLGQISDVEVTPDTYSSDHNLVLAALDSTPKFTSSNTSRLNLKKVDWEKFHHLLMPTLDLLEVEMGLNEEPLVVYKSLINNIKSHLIESGAYYPSSLHGVRKSQPLWWDLECDQALLRRREARKGYLKDQSLLNRLKFDSIDNEVKRFLKNKKRSSFVDFCNNINKSSGMTETWAKVKAFASSTQPPRTGVYNDPDSSIFKNLQDDLVREDVSLSRLPDSFDQSIDSSLNDPFSDKEFFQALNYGRPDSSPGIDSITNLIIRKLPNKAKKLLLMLFNEFYLESIFPEEWRNIRVVFVPKPNGKGFRPISLSSTLCKLFERMVHKRLEHYIESRDAIPLNQYGFRRGRSTTDCVSALITDISFGFAKREHTIAVAVDLK